MCSGAGIWRATWNEDSLHFAVEVGIAVEKEKENAASKVQHANKFGDWFKVKVADSANGFLFFEYL